jgi:hypothetical protein
MLHSTDSSTLFRNRFTTNRHVNPGLEPAIPLSMNANEMAVEAVSMVAAGARAGHSGIS